MEGRSLLCLADYWISVYNIRKSPRQIPGVAFNSNFECIINLNLGWEIGQMKLSRKTSKDKIKETVPQTDTGSLGE